MAHLINELTESLWADLVHWACPVPFFGQVTDATVATVGINPSNREFVGTDGTELDGQSRRLPTLNSLSLRAWSEADGSDVREVTKACLAYFDRNPYKLWFDVLERMLNIGGFSYYGGRPAAHVDLVAYATGAKWGMLPAATRSDLIVRGRRTLAEIIRDSPIQVLILNGRSVVDAFQDAAQVDLHAAAVPAWTLPRSSGTGVTGIRYSGALTSLSGVEFDRQVRVIGFNHNLQSSYGVTRSVVEQIAKEVGDAVAARGPYSSG